jgi:hypothetical protein
MVFAITHTFPSIPHFPVSSEDNPYHPLHPRLFFETGKFPQIPTALISRVVVGNENIIVQSSFRGICCFSLASVPQHKINEIR